MTGPKFRKKCRGATLEALTVLLFLAGSAVLMPPPAAAQSWPPLSAEEKAMTDCPQQPGADAVWLFRETIVNGKEFEISIFKRLKVLKESGRGRADIEIPYSSGDDKVTKLEIRHIRPNGQIVPFRGQIFDKTALRYRRYRVALKTFAVPDVQVGSVIEFRYKLVADSSGAADARTEALSENLGFSNSRPTEGGRPFYRVYVSVPAAHLDLQDDLFTVKARFEFISNPYIDSLFEGPWRLAWASHKLPGASKPAVDKARIELSLENVPPFEGEELMVSEEAEQMSLDIFYLDVQIADRDEFWKRESRAWQSTAERFIGDSKKVAAQARALIGGETDPGRKLRKIYEGVQKLRNLSYEKGLTAKKKEEQKIKFNYSAAEVIARGYGVRSDITRTFVALARAAGFSAEPVRVVNRDNKLFRPALMSFYSQLDAEVAQVRLGDKTQLLDPATPLCPLGLLHWSRSNSVALRYSDDPPSFFMTTSYPPDIGLTQREVALALDAGGGLAGTVMTTYRGHEAMVRRLEHMHDDAEAWKKAMEKELADILPMGATVTLTGLENADNSEPALVATFEVAIPGAATSAGGKTLLPIIPMAGEPRYPLRRTTRNFPVCFPFPYSELDDIVIILPEGLTAEVRPEGRKEQNDFSAYSLACAGEGPQRLHIRRELSIKKSLFPVDQYAALKAFFDAARAADEERIVLTTAKKESRTGRS